jgi:serine/threonine protein kinase
LLFSVQTRVSGTMVFYEECYDKILFIISIEIGKGGFGRVYESEWNHTRVAVKVSNAVANLDDFRREAELVMYVFCILCNSNIDSHSHSQSQSPFYDLITFENFIILET